MKTIFLSIGFQEASDEGHEPVDKVVMQYCLNAIFQQAVTYGHKIILRDHPAITSLAEVYFEAVKPGMATVPETMGAREIIFLHAPDIVFYLGGNEEMMTDHRDFARIAAVKNVPLLGTGGATSLVERALLPEMREQLDKDGRVDQHGFERIARALMGPRPALR